MALVPQDPIFAARRENIRFGALMPVMRKSQPPKLLPYDFLTALP
jgi:hypothetical protein